MFCLKILGKYSKESFTQFERDYMKRAVPFYAWTRGSVPLMGKQLVLSPGKYAQFGKLANAAVGGQKIPQYTEGDFTWMWPWDESTGTNSYYPEFVLSSSKFVVFYDMFGGTL
jgi:hypothetical protein